MPHVHDQYLTHIVQPLPLHRHTPLAPDITGMTSRQEGDVRPCVVRVIGVADMSVSVLEWSYAISF